MADDEGVPDGKGQEKRQPLAGALMRLGEGLPPEIPIGRKNGHAHRYDVLLELEGSKRPPMPELFHGNSDVSAVLDVDPRTQDESGNIEDRDCHRVPRRRHWAK